MEHFFNQYGDLISAEEVIREIDGNTAKLEKTESRLFIPLQVYQYDINSSFTFQNARKHSATNAGLYFGFINCSYGSFNLSGITAMGAIFIFLWILLLLFMLGF